MNNCDHISFSSLSDYYKCPFLFKLLHIDKIDMRKDSIFMSFGTACHYICENLIENKIKNEDINKIFDEKFKKELNKFSEKSKKELSADFINEFRNQGKRLFPNFINSMKEYYPSYEVIGVEIPLMEPITNFETQIKFKGFIDLILKSENKIHIIDLKTCSWGWDARKKNDKKMLYQLILYKVFLSQKLNIPLEDIETHFCLLKRTSKKDVIENFKITSGKKRIENAIEYMRIPCYNIEHNRFLKRKTSCENCEFKNTEYCK